MAQNATVSKHEWGILRRTIAAFGAAHQDMGEDVTQEARRRAEQIRALPTREWKGHTLYTIRCHGTRGKGPHDCHVPESLLWSLMDFRAYRCVFHAGDDPLAQETERGR